MSHIWFVWHGPGEEEQQNVNGVPEATPKQYKFRDMFLFAVTSTEDIMWFLFQSQKTTLKFHVAYLVGLQALKGYGTIEEPGVSKYVLTMFTIILVEAGQPHPGLGAGPAAAGIFSFSYEAVARSLLDLARFPFSSCWLPASLYNDLYKIRSWVTILVL